MTIKEDIVLDYIFCGPESPLFDTKISTRRHMSLRTPRNGLPLERSPLTANHMRLLQKHKEVSLVLRFQPRSPTIQMLQPKQLDSHFGAGYSAIISGVVVNENGTCSSFSLVRSRPSTEAAEEALSLKANVQSLVPAATKVRNPQTPCSPDGSKPAQLHTPTQIKETYSLQLPPTHHVCAINLSHMCSSSSPSSLEGFAGRLMQIWWKLP